jgi:hypothetical protein
MVYVIENTGHQQIGKTLHSLKSIVRPDGGTTTNAKVDEQLHDEEGAEYWIRDVAETRSGEGPRRLNTPSAEYVEGEGWQRITNYGAELEAPADPQGADEDAEGYDENYADNYKYYRQRSYPSIDEITVALWEKTVEDRADAADAVEVLRQAVKTKYPSPAKIASDKAAAIAEAEAAAIAAAEAEAAAAAEETPE